jgi:cytosine/adenosine deaminase-related metal-dependent hydrolase
VEQLLLANVRPMGGPTLDLLVVGERIAAVGAGFQAPAGAAVVDGRGQLALPGLVDAHAHLDKTLWGLPWRPHTAGDGLAALIENEHRGRAELAEAGVTVAERAGNLLDAYVAAGTTHIRSHVDVDTAAGLDSLHGVMEARAAFADRISVELVAFPQSGLLFRPGTAELLDAAVREGADLVGGLDPAGFDHRPVEYLDTIFAIADRHGRGLDIHLHEGGELGAFTLPHGRRRRARPAALLAWRAGARRDEDLAVALEVATFGGATVLGLPGYGLDPGCAADLVLLPATTLGEAVVTHPPRTLNLKAGRILRPAAGRSSAGSPVADEDHPLVPPAGSRGN